MSALRSSPFLLPLFISVFSVSIRALASEREAAYLNDLKIAESKILRFQAPAPEAPGTLHSLLLPAPLSPLGRNYRVGDQWDVAAIRTEDSAMRMTSDPQHLTPTSMRIGIFHYEVIRAGSTRDSEFAIRVKPVVAAGILPIDSRVEAIELSARPGVTQTQKSYFFRGHPNPVRVIPEALHSSITPLELYPLDIPETLYAESKAPEEFPKLPPEFSRLPIRRAETNLSLSLWLEQDDFFGRPIQMLWQKGEPWPAYLKTSSGISILIRKANP